MFATDKELRKGTSTSKNSRQGSSTTARGTSGGAGRNSKDSSINSRNSQNNEQHLHHHHQENEENSLIVKLKQDRLDRQHHRDINNKAMLIQRNWRRSHSQRLLQTSLRKEFDKKLVDIENVAMILSKTKGITFLPPINISLELYRIILFMKFHDFEDGVRLIRYFKIILNISLLETDEDKNLIMIISQNNHLLFKLFVIIEKTIVLHFSRHSLISMDQVSDLLLGVRYLFGLGAPYRMSYPTRINSAFRHIRSECFDFHHYFHHKDLHLFHLFASILTKQSLAIHLTNTLSEDENSQGVVSSLNGLKRPTRNCLGDQLLLLSLDVCSLDNELKFERQKIALREFFAVPVFTYLTSTFSLQSYLATSEILSTLLSLFNETTQIVLPPSPILAFKSGQWLVGNITSICCFLPLDPRVGLQSNAAATTASASSSLSTTSAASDQREIIHDQLLIDYFNLLVTLLIKYDIPNVWQGRRGVIWMRDGTTLIASAIPRALQFQLLSLSEGGNMKRLYSRCIAPLGNSAAVPFSAANQKHSSTTTPIESQHISPRKKDSIEVLEALSTSSLKMARESLIEQKETANSWLGSKWASKMMKSVSKAFNIFNSSEQVPTQTNATEAFKNSLVNSELIEEEISPFYPNDLLASTLCKLWCLLLPQAATSSPESICWKGLSVLSFSTHAVNKLWALAVRNGTSQSFFSSNEDSLILSFPLIPDNVIRMNRDLCPGMANGLEIIITMTAILKIICIALDDSELYDKGIPLPLPHILPFIRFLNNLLFHAIEENPSLLLSELSASISGISGGASSSDPIKSQSNSEKAFQLSYQINSLKCVVSVLADFHTRWARRPFSFAKLWEIPKANSREMLGELRRDSSPLARALLRFQPWSVDFHQRMKLFREIIDSERTSIQGSDDVNLGQRSRGVVVRIRRQRILSDGMDALDRVGSSIKDRIVVRYVNDFGEDEAGIDIGGLFKDFWTDLSARVFNPSFGLFAMTSSQLLYPNPNSVALYDESELDTTYEFLGKILGKALFENITVQPQFAHFFLAFMMGRYNFTGLVNDLSSLDPELFKNLMFLKTYEGEIQDLGLTFSLTDDAYGAHREVELFPGGSRVEVTSKNRHRYINLTAKYYLHDRICRQSRSFFSGLYRVINPDLLGMFCAPELQVLISGACSEISVEDLQANTRYVAGYHSLDRNITRLWEVVNEMNEVDRGLFIKFVTSCERPPSLGFSALNPPFTIQRVDCNDDSRLPTASTCFNILKLPTYSNKNILRVKLLTAIRSNSGFDLT